MSHLSRLNARQLVLLQRIANGPVVTSKEPTLATSVYALRNRKLVTTPRSAGIWSAVITEAGLAYLAHGDYPHPPARSAPKASRRPSAAAIEQLSGVELMRRLDVGAGELTISDPAPPVRRMWHRALYQAASSGLVPAGQRLRHSGRNHGDLVIRLTSADPPPGRVKPTPVPVPERLLHPHPVIVATRARLTEQKPWKGWLDSRRLPGVLALRLTKDHLPRALRIGHALIQAAEQRGLEVDAMRDEPLTLGAKGHRYRVTISEITSRQDYVPTAAEKAHQARYNWQSYPSFEDLPTGNLQLQLPQMWSRGQHRNRWRDSSRWRLEDKLGEVLVALEERVDADELRRLQRDQEARDRQAAQERAELEARRRFIEDKRAEVLRSQVASWEEAGRIRAWIAAVQANQANHHDAETMEWLDWAKSFADRIDSTLHRLGPPKLREPLHSELLPYLQR